MHFVYIIYTATYDRYYIGETSNISERIKEHNTAYYPNAATKYTDDWEVRLSFKVENRVEARKVEKYIKSMKSKEFITRLIFEEEYLDIFKQTVLEKYQIKIL
jgi:putative endonuclease